MGAAAAAHFFDYVGGGRIEGMGRTQRFGQSQLIVGNVNGRDFKAQMHGNLNRQMPQTADAEDGQPLSALWLWPA